MSLAKNPSLMCFKKNKIHLTVGKKLMCADIFIVFI